MRRLLLKNGFLSIAVLLSLCGTVQAAQGGWQKIAPRELARLIAAGDSPLLINTMGEIECRDQVIACKR